MSKAVFLDRDGTINLDKHYIYRIEDFQFISGVIEGLRLLQDAGYKLIIITNQSGIARGYYTEDEYFILNDWMLEKLADAGVVIDKVYYCPHHPDAKVEKYKRKCTCRKPGLKLFEDAIKAYDIELSSSYAIGDKLRDVAICENTDCRGYLIGESESREVLEKAKMGNIKNVKYKKNLLECVRDILDDERCGV